MSSGTVDDISDNIGRITLSKDDCDTSASKISSSSIPEEVTSTKKCTSCEQNLDHNDAASGSISGEVDNALILYEKLCANCGKEGANNTCNKCKQVKYCNAACKKKHRHKHKNDCEEHLRLAAEHAAKLHDIELFKQPPPKEDCPICFICLPTSNRGVRYKMCCGKTICCGCIYTVQKADGFVGLCPFCRTATPTSNEEVLARLKKRMDNGDAEALHICGCYYEEGQCGLTQNHSKAFELQQKAAYLGFGEAYFNIGNACMDGRGVERDFNMGVRFWEVAARKGSASARHNLGMSEEEEGGNLDIALRHFMIAIRSGVPDSLERIKRLYSAGHVTKDDYKDALRSYQTYLSEVKSDQRDEAAAFSDTMRYV